MLAPGFNVSTYWPTWPFFANVTEENGEFDGRAGMTPDDAADMFTFSFDPSKVAVAASDDGYASFSVSHFGPVLYMAEVSFGFNVGFEVYVDILVFLTQRPLARAA